MTALRRKTDTPRPCIHLPDDEGAHPDSLVEWWYLNTTLMGSDGCEYGVMAAYFSPGLRIIVVSDICRRRLHQEVSGSTPRFSTGPLNLVWGGRDRWQRIDGDSPSYRLNARGRDIEVELTMESRKPPLLAGGDGLVRWSGGTSYYYSLTNLKTSGSVTVAGRTIDVEGTGWMDHQWMANLGRRGWDWFAIQLDGDTEVLVWQIVNADHSIESRDMMVMYPDGSTYHSRDPRIDRAETWTSPGTGVEYGVAWRIREDGRGINLEVKARYAEQEIRMFELMPEAAYQFWEGNTVISGRLDGREVSGTGHAEIVRSIDPLSRVP